VAERLAEHTTLRVGGPAAEFVVAESEADLLAAVAEADAAGTPVLVLGGGSNLVVADAGFDGRVVRVASKDSFIPLGDAANLVLLSEEEIEAAALALCSGVTL